MTGISPAFLYRCGFGVFLVLVGVGIWHLLDDSLPLGYAPGLLWALSQALLVAAIMIDPVPASADVRRAEGHG